jgi:hypothetical protein
MDGCDPRCEHRILTSNRESSGRLMCGALISGAGVICVHPERIKQLYPDGIDMIRIRLGVFIAVEPTVVSEPFAGNSSDILAGHRTRIETVGSGRRMNSAKCREAGFSAQYNGSNV